MNVFSGEGLFWLITFAVLALAYATWLALRMDVWLPRSDRSTAVLRGRVQIYLLEPWFTLAWLGLSSSTSLAQSLGYAPGLQAFIITLPMALLFIVWRPYPRSGYAFPQLLWLLRLYGPVRWVITFLLLTPSQSFNLDMAWAGTVILWLNLLQIRLTLGSPRPRAQATPDTNDGAYSKEHNY